MNESNDITIRNGLRSDSWDRAIYAYATGYIFQKRAEKYKKLLQLLTFLGIVVPVLIGGVVLSFGTEFKLLNVLIVIAGIAGLIQLIASVWALSADWQGNYTYSSESMSANFKLATSYATLGKTPPDDLEALKTQHKLLVVEDQARRDSDTKQNVTEEEKRAGTRAGLRHYQRPCVSCEKVPNSMQPTNCPVCGNFSPKLS